MISSRALFDLCLDTRDVTRPEPWNQPETRLVAWVSPDRSFSSSGVPERLRTVRLVTCSVVIYVLDASAHQRGDVPVCKAVVNHSPVTPCLNQIAISEEP